MYSGLPSLQLTIRTGPGSVPSTVGETCMLQLECCPAGSADTIKRFGKVQGKSRIYVLLISVSTVDVQVLAAAPCPPHHLFWPSRQDRGVLLSHEAWEVRYSTLQCAVMWQIEAARVVLDTLKPKT